MSPDTSPTGMEALKARAPQAADLLRQLSNANRLLILCHISQDERSVSQLEQDLGIKQPGLSQQLAELRQSGLVKTRRESRSIFYSIADERALAVMAMLHEIFCKDPRAVTERLADEAAPSAAPAEPRGDRARFARMVPPSERR
jgi:DNA-binding transcriptional ArsR family regulator